MAKNATISNAVRSLMANAIDQEFDNGYLRLYDGTQPAGPDTALTGQTLLAELRFAVTAVSSESNGVLTFATLTGEDAALATGTVTWARCLKADGTTAIMDVTVDTTNANVIVPTTSVAAGIAVNVTSMSVTAAAASAL